MAKVVEDARIVSKRSTVTTTVATVPTSNDHTDGSWLTTDIYKGEIFINLADDVIQTRTNSGIIHIATRAWVTTQIALQNELSEVLANGNVTGGTNLLISGGDYLVFKNNTNSNNVGLRAGVTSAGYDLTLPTAQGGSGQALVNDGSGNLSWGTVASSLSSVLTVGNTTGGTNILISGGDYLVFKNGTNSNNVGVRAGVTSAGYDLTLPTAQGASNTYLKNDGSGNLSWATVTAGSTNFDDSVFYIYDNGDNTKKLAFEVSGVTTATTRTKTVQDTNGTLAEYGNKLSVFAATTSAELAGVISDETGSGSLVFATSPTLVTPTLGVASATSINKVAITAPATGSTLTIADGKTLTVSNTLTFTGTDSSSVAFGAGGTVVYTTATQTLTNKRNTKRVVSVASSATPTLNTDNTDVAQLTGLATNITNASTNLSGTPNHGDVLLYEITDNGTARTITWGSSFAASGSLALPTTTVISTLLRTLFVYDSTSSKWVIGGLS